MVVVMIDGKRFEVRGRVAEMIAWLVKSSDRLNGSIGVRFAYHGPALKAVLETEETINSH